MAALQMLSGTTRLLFCPSIYICLELTLLCTINILSGHLYPFVHLDIICEQFGLVSAVGSLVRSYTVSSLIMKLIGVGVVPGQKWPPHQISLQSPTMSSERMDSTSLLRASSAQGPCDPGFFMRSWPYRETRRAETQHVRNLAVWRQTSAQTTWIPSQMRASRPTIM